MYNQQPIIWLTYNENDPSTYDKNNVTCDVARTVYTNQGLLNLASVKAACENNTFALDCCRQRNDITGVSKETCNHFWGGVGDGSTCDVLMTKFCDKNPDDISCACLKSKLPLPYCIDNKCANEVQAFRSSIQRKEFSVNKCQNLDIQICNNYFEAKENGTSQINPKMDLTCTQIIKNAQIPPTNNRGDGSQSQPEDIINQQNSSTTSEAEASAPSSILLFVGIGVVVVAIIAAVLIAVFVISKKKRQKQLLLAMQQQQLWGQQPQPQLPYTPPPQTFVPQQTFAPYYYSY